MTAIGTKFTFRFNARLSGKQISPDKSMNFHCTAASFTVAVKTHGFVVLCQLTSSLRLI
jgi:hypothetical protein